MSFIAVFSLVLLLYGLAPFLVNETGCNLWWLLYILCPGGVWVVGTGLLIYWRIHPPRWSEQTAGRTQWWVWQENLPWPKESHPIPQSNRGCLLTIVNRFLFILDFISPLQVMVFLSCCFPCWQYAYQTTKRWFVELYVFLWVSVGVVAALLVNSNLTPWKYTLAVLLIWRLVDILQSTLRLSFLRKPDVIPARSLILLAFNYFELIVIFAVVGFVYQGSNSGCFHDSLQCSFNVFVPLVAAEDGCSLQIPPRGILFYVEVFVSLIVHVAVVQRVLSLFTQQR